MKKQVSIVAKNKGWHLDQLKAAAQRLNVQAEFLQFATPDEAYAYAKDFAPVVLWRSSGLDTRSERAALATPLLRERTIVNNCVFETPYVSYKYYQQKVAAQANRVPTIPTYRAKTIEALEAHLTTKNLSYPFIAKPNYGDQGKGIHLVKDAAGLQQLTELDKYVFQNFIPNDGDWRAIVVGGRVLGVMKRIAADGSYLNNISQGGSSRLETDSSVVKEVSRISLEIAALFGYTYCGVDIIQNRETGEFYFLEVNSAPQWDGEQGFQAVTGVDVAEEIMSLCGAMAERGVRPTAELIREYYDKHLGTLENSKRVHYLSRLYLWTHDDDLHTQLEKERNDYLGKDEAAIRQTISKIIEKPTNEESNMVAARGEYFKKYNMLRSYNSILFKVLFAESLYGLDIRPIVREFGLDEDMQQLYQDLLADESALRILSTHAINFLYGLRNYLKDDKLELDPRLFIEVARGYRDEVASGKITTRQASLLHVYLLTHAIIGESYFYARRVVDPRYIQLVRAVEDIIRHNYSEVNIDNKFEFLVCAALCGYRSDLQSVIHAEADDSWSKQGNFLTDTMNHWADRHHKDKFSLAEHRNVLYLMSQLPFVKAGRNEALKGETTMLGRVVDVSLPEMDIEGVEARVDTGAKYNALHVTNIETFEKEGTQWLRFTPLSPRHRQHAGDPVETDQFKILNIRTSAGHTDQRYVVYQDLAIAGRVLKRQKFTLADRTRMIHPILIGRTTLRNNFLVDVRLLEAQA